jgi:hypothetical protein
MYTWRSYRTKLKLILPPILLVISQIFIFGPATIYAGNILEFGVTFLSVLKYYGIPAIVLVLLFLGVGIFLSRKYFTLYLSLTFTIGILLWVQGNFLVWEYGLLDGKGIDWTINVWRRWADGILWIAFLMMACIFHRRIFKIAVIASIAVLSLQLVYLVFISIQSPEIWRTKEDVALSISPPEEIFEFSSKQNIIHVILDECQSDIFHDIINEDIDYYYSALEGFTFFEETTGAFSKTRLSIPAILSGQYYKNDIPLKDFVDSVFKGKTIPNVLYDNGYEVDLVHAIHHYIKGHYSNAYIIPIPYNVTKHQYELANATLMLDLVLFRFVPHYFKDFIYNHESWLIQRLLPQRDYAHTRHFAHKAFLQDLIYNMSITRTKPVYKFIHLETTHGPAVVNEKCEYVGGLPTTIKNFKVQYRCSLINIVKFLNKLKLMGIYKSSLILIHADHGLGTEVKMRNMNKQLDGLQHFSDRIVGAALPLMLIKPPYSKGPLKVSKAQTQLVDIPATISSILNLDEKFNGQSMFEIVSNEVRKRKFCYYEWRFRNWKQNVYDRFFNRLDVFFIEGSVYDRASWRLDSSYYSPEKKLYKTQKIDFGTNEASGFLRFGWGNDERNSKTGLTYNWAMGKSASIFLSLPKKETMRLTANVKNFLNSQTITIKLDGKEIGVWDLSNRWEWQLHSIVIRPEKDRPDVSVVEFIFSQQKKPDGKDKRPLAVLFESITLSEGKDKDKG